MIIANGQKVPSTGIGTVRLLAKGFDGDLLNVVLKGVLVVPSISRRLATISEEDS